VADKTTRHDIEVRIIARAWKDPKFAEALRKDPTGVVTREMTAAWPGAKMPAGLTIKVLEETPDTMYLVVPPRPRGADELSEAELLQVAGGHGYDS
jgi:hypothetical protein